eukprot:CAMPEP_0204277946 /NCGR_PEP_ID=MMETSP0468-20130131/29593_1 /ASSEMBLY_ACC=CAM_ASM_000383 /TAXON_ID=2969 /ORGANISM="Oxyrrhis marina" /LENGTH=133 /DNA_ID=CAMNT_0051254799 /DNA_START=390 /DNA_END=789 /DNA_ORIENTATION=-
MVCAGRSERIAQLAALLLSCSQLGLEQIPALLEPLDLLLQSLLLCRGCAVAEDIRLASELLGHSVQGAEGGLTVSVGHVALVLDGSNDAMQSLDLLLAAANLASRRSARSSISSAFCRASSLAASRRRILDKA